MSDHPQPNNAEILPAQVGILLGSKTDLEIMEQTVLTLGILKIRYEILIASVHRTPDEVKKYAETAGDRGIQVMIAGAGGAAALPGMVEAWSRGVPVLGVPIPTKHLNGMDSLCSIVQMPRGSPVGTLAIGEAGAVNAAILAAKIVGNSDPEVRARVVAYQDTLRHKSLQSNVELQRRIAEAYF